MALSLSSIRTRQQNHGFVYWPSLLAQPRDTDNPIALRGSCSFLTLWRVTNVETG
jgi:hypothetical protein